MPKQEDRASLYHMSKQEDRATLYHIPKQEDRVANFRSAPGNFVNDLFVLSE